MITYSGEYRNSITITLKTVSGQEDRGQDVYSTTTIGTCLAKIEDLSGRALEIARQLVKDCTHRITIRYMSGVTPECQMVFGSRTFNVGAVLNKLNTNFVMEILASEVQ